MLHRLTVAITIVSLTILWLAEWELGIWATVWVGIGMLLVWLARPVLSPLPDNGKKRIRIVKSTKRKPK